MIAIVACTTIVLISGLFVLRASLSARPYPSLCLGVGKTDTVCFQKAEVLDRHKPTALTVSRSGSILAVGRETTIELWNLQTRRKIQELSGHQDFISAIAISPDEQILVSSSLDNTIRFWNLTTGRLIGTISDQRASVLTFSPNGLILASGSRMQHWPDGENSPIGVQFWAVSTRQRLFGLGDEAIRAIAFSPEGRFLAAGGTKTVVWQLQDGDPLYTLNSGELTGLSFAQDGQSLLTGSSKIKLWDLTNGNLIRSFDSGALDIAISPDGQTMAMTTGGTVQLWETQTEQIIGALRGSLYSGLFVEFALGGNAIVTGSTDGIRFWPGERLPPTDPT